MKLKNYKEATNYLLKFTDLEKKPGQSLSKENFSLDKVKKLANLCGNPQKKYKSVHVGGTKGKGSTSALIELGLRHEGFKTGMFTQPHLIEFTERFRINGASISKDEFTDTLNYLLPHISMVENIQTFEIMTILAFKVFENHGVDRAIIEVGLGGRLDATNIISPEISAITPIFKEHTSVLGSTIKEIATEKAGIIKPRTPIVISKQSHNDAEKMFKVVAKENNSIFIDASKKIKIEKIKQDSLHQEICIANIFDKVSTSLLGDHQLVNIQTAITVLLQLGVSKKSIKHAISHINWPGRFQKIRKREATFILDAAHIPESINYVASTIGQIYTNKVTVILGLSSDKNVKKIISLLKPISSQIITTKSNHPRSMSPKKIANECKKQNVKNTISHSVEDALKLIPKTKKSKCLITGSFFVVGEALKNLSN
ncbi:bifunctional folylpolyglutamate synthase/dihydrofolate synthase [Patescibacteria group bacterium]